MSLLRAALRTTTLLRPLTTRFYQFPLSSSTMTDSNLQGIQETLTKLESIGIKLQWDADQGAAKGKNTSHEYLEEEGLKSSFEELMALVRNVSDRGLVGSLLAGPDNESDESTDVPLLLDPYPRHHPRSLIQFTLDQLDLEPYDIQNMVIKEQVKQRTCHQDGIYSDFRPLMLKRIYQTGRLDTNEEVEANEASPEAPCEVPCEAPRLEEIMIKFQPRVHFEFEIVEHPSIVVCVFVGHLPRLLFPEVPSYSIGGLISYRIQS